ncbi:MAG: ATP-binding cassette domain-containing protein [Verrucomicrobia bacterium]|nr:ATP-binding cassette domain-containing protein [Verrucomicrobiota bacterium]
MIKVQNLTKHFGTKAAVDGVSFSVERGEVLGFLGPNGAGKSTTMRMITGFIPPTSGTVQVGSFNMLEQPLEAKRIIGYLPESAPLYSDMTVWGFLNFAAELRGIQGDDRKKAVNRAIEMCFLEAVIHQSIETLSKGYRHRTCFAQAIIHDPDVLIMDEPTDGLDPNQKHEMRSLIKRMGEKKAIIFSTHILEEVDAACTRAIIIDRGRIVANGTPAELKARSEFAGAVFMRIKGLSAQAVTDNLKKLSATKRVAVLGNDGDGIAARVFPRNPGSADLAREVGIMLGQNNWKPDELHSEEGRLDDVFRSITWSDTAKEKGEKTK